MLEAVPGAGRHGLLRGRRRIAEIDRLEAKADSAAADARVQYEEQIAKAKASRDDLRQKLGEIRKAGDEAWQELKSGLDQAWDSLSAAVKSARSKLDE